ncbi:MAG: dockerin type I domain-containing protein [Bacteroidales bacterium]|nr:dockerin type I domain-containing protein [Bacteroidales bacterium]
MKKCILLFFSAILYAIGLNAQTTIPGGYFSVDRTLTLANSPYIITGNQDVSSTATVTIEKGVEIRFSSGTYLQVFGTLNAKGVKFTANASTTKGFWDGIYVSYEYSASNGSVTLDSCNVEYASNLYSRKGQLNLKKCTLNNFSNYGVQISGAGKLYIENTTIKNTNYPIYFSGAGELKTGVNNVLTGNTIDNIYVNFSEIPGNFYMPEMGIPYRCSTLNVALTGCLFISPGAELRLVNTEININGKVKAIGTAAKPIIFDKHSTASYWLGINVTPTAIDTACILKYCILNNTYSYDYDQYAALEINSASPSIDNCKFTNNGRNLVVYGLSKPTFTNSTFDASSIVGGECYNISLAMDAAPVFTNDSIKFNSKEIRAIKIMASNVIDDARLKKLSFKNLDNPSYCIYGMTTVLDTATLTIDPGVVMKCNDYNARITANGTLTGLGTILEPIVFTSIADDTYGNPLDSQNNGIQAISHSSAGWINLFGKKTSKIENWKIQYAGGYPSDNVGYWAISVSSGNIVSKCEIKNSFRAINFSDNAQILNNSFINIDTYPLGRNVNQGTPVLIGNTVANVGNIGIIISSFGTDSPTLKSFDFAGFTNVAYIIENTQTIPSGDIVSVDPGVVVKYTSNGLLAVNGALKAVGKSNNKIIFTSLKDDSASGDSNNNGTATTPASGDWYGMDYSGTASDIDNILKNFEIRYSGNYYYYGTKGAIRITDCKVSIDSVKVNFSNSCALGIFGTANPVITNSLFYNLANAPICMDMFSSPVFSGTGNKIANTPRIGLLIRSQTIQGTVPIRSFAGYDTITYITEEAMTVTNQLTIPAGVTFKGPGIWYIKGRLDIQGTALKPVVFTTQEDDAYGNPKDLQQNGNTALSNSGAYFVFYDESNDLSTIDHGLFRYSPAIPIQLTNASPKIQNSAFENLIYSGISLSGSSAPAITGCTFNNISFPFTTSLVTYPSVSTGNIISGTTGRAIRVTDETLTQDVILPKRDFAGKVNIPYVFQNYTVGTGAKLTIKPGVVCKFMSSGYLNIQNGLIAKGGSTTDSTIVFTADRDDFYGGDTYGDGDANQPTKSYWQGIYFLNESIDENCWLENCILKDGTYNYYYNYYPQYDRGAITLDNSSPTIKNCLFESNYYGIIARNTSLPKITNCDFVGTDPTSGYGIYNQTATNTVTATGCWWNSNTGPKHASNPGGLGERVSDYVNFTPWATQLAKPVLGDVSMNGEVKPYDASLVLQYAAGNITLSTKQKSVADVSGNGVVSSFDASLILQYSVGLISRFDPQPGKKSAMVNDLATISYPDQISEPAKKTFQIPVTISTAQGIKALDLKFAIDENHIKFIQLNNTGLPANISVASGFHAQKGEIIISMASAYDLDLLNQSFVLEFEFQDSEITGSQFGLTFGMANDYYLDDLPPTAQISGNSGMTGIGNQQNNPKPIVYTDQNGIHTKFNLSKSNQNIQVQVVDMTGRIIYSRSVKNLSSGVQNFDLNYADLENLHDGVYILSIRGEEFSYSKKLLIK